MRASSPELSLVDVFSGHDPPRYSPQYTYSGVEIHERTCDDENQRVSVEAHLFDLAGAHALLDERPDLVRQDQYEEGEDQDDEELRDLTTVTRGDGIVAEKRLAAKQHAADGGVPIAQHKENKEVET